MAITVKVGDEYPEIKKGMGSKGEWGYVTAKAEKGSDKILIWFANPEEVPEDAFAVRIDEIVDAKVSAKQYNNQWYKTYAITAKVSAIDGGADPLDLDEGVPF